MQIHRQAAGAIIIGGDYRGLGIIRSLGRRQIPLCILRDEHSLGSFSRFVRYRFDWPDDSEKKQVEFLNELAVSHGFHNWALFPTGDETAALIARNYDSLSDKFVLTTPHWQTLRRAYDKRHIYRLASELDIPHPWTLYPSDRAYLARAELSFPAVLKPAIKHEQSRFTREKAWPVSNRRELLERYDEACVQIDPGAVIVQELIPGDGDCQFSFAALCAGGRPLASIVVRRQRQHPINFGQSSSFVESVAQPAVEEFSRRVLAELGFTGLIEIEFKRDPRDGALKLLDINPRVWGWHTVGRRAGVDFPFLVWQLINGIEVPVQRGREGVRWVRGLTDLLAALQQVRSGNFSLIEHLRSLRLPIEFAVWAGDDPLPALCEIPSMLAARWRISRKLQHKPPTLLQKIDFSPATLSSGPILSRARTGFGMKFRNRA